VTVRTTPAFLVAALVTPILYCFVNAVDGGFHGGLSEMLVTAAVVYMFALLATLLVALPVFLLAKRAGLLRWWVALATGGGLGALCASLIGPGNFASPWLRGHLPLAGIGTLSALAFWLMWRPVSPPNQRLERP
jgi:hypothetical protein